MTQTPERILSARENGEVWLRRFHPAPDHRPRLICFPHAGGSATYYFGMSALLAPHVEVLAVQYPGRQDRRLERHVETLQDLAEPIFEALGEYADQPMAFFGHSMGAVVAFEVARLMQERLEVAPRHLFASGRRAPSRYREGRVHTYDDHALAAELVQVGGTDQRFLNDHELRAAILPVVRGDYRAVEGYRYRPGPQIDCPVTVLVGDRDPQTTFDEASAWREHCTGAFAMRVLTGGHFYLDAHRAEIVDIVSTALRQPSFGHNASGGVL